MLKYFVLDISSGLNDGFYGGLDAAKESLEVMKERYSNIPWIVSKIEVEPEDERLFYQYANKTFHAKVDIS
jgi:hypothetical protein